MQQSAFQCSPRWVCCDAALIKLDCLAIAYSSGLTPKHICNCKLQVLNKKVTMCSSLVDRAQHLLDPGSPDAMRLVWTLLVLYCTMAVPALAWAAFALRKLLKRSPSAKASASSPSLLGSGSWFTQLGCLSMAVSTATCSHKALSALPPGSACGWTQQRCTARRQGSG